MYMILDKKRIIIPNNFSEDLILALLVRLFSLLKLCIASLKMHPLQNNLVFNI